MAKSWHSQGSMPWRVTERYPLPSNPLHVCQHLIHICACALACDRSVGRAAGTTCRLPLGRLAGRSLLVPRLRFFPSSATCAISSRMRCLAGAGGYAHAEWKRHASGMRCCGWQVLPGWCQPARGRPSPHPPSAAAGPPAPAARAWCWPCCPPCHPCVPRPPD
jgi:hypothetical protein